MRVHFIAIGGSAMHNLAIAMKLKGYRVTGSDDEIFEPSLSRLKKHGLLPSYKGWNPEMITSELDAIVLGMHARADNPELQRAKELGIKIYSYPEYLYEQSKNKTRIVVGGSHGKTTITTMIMHVLKHAGLKFDYMVGAQLKGFDTMVAFSDDSEFAVFEGDEYLTSPIDPRPKFHLYRPNIAIISGISWDHINVFPTFQIYKDQFTRFINLIEPEGTLIYSADDAEVCSVVETANRNDISFIPYKTHPYKTNDGKCKLIAEDQLIDIRVFGGHNLKNIAAAKAACNTIGVSDNEFYNAIKSFEGAAKRLQLLARNDFTSVYLDFAHSPSKVKATVDAVKSQYPNRQLVTCFELHTFSSLNKKFLSEYKGAFDSADFAYVYFNPHTIEHKKLEPIEPNDVMKGFGRSDLKVFTSAEQLVNDIEQIDWRNKNLLIMTSGNFGGTDLQLLADKLVGNRVVK
jgi:UDP-N-acetylmuramate: L-alanyl-gamma-D-glutamyl-meso-diaminopimelate ligase